jgi:hypothetical protein
MNDFRSRDRRTWIPDDEGKRFEWNIEHHPFPLRDGVLVWEIRESIPSTIQGNIVAVNRILASLPALGCETFKLKDDGSNLRVVAIANLK